MAEIQLRLSETDEEHMPDACMVCGREPIVTHVSKKFAWMPPWFFFVVPFLALLGGIPAAIVAAVVTRRATVAMPACERHRHYWLKRNLLTWLPLVAFAGIGGTTFAIAANAGPGQNQVASYVCIAFVPLAFLWLFAAAIFQMFFVRPKEITDRIITLKNVHKDFVEAFNRHRKKRNTGFDRSYVDDVEDYDERLRRRRDQNARRRTGHEPPPSDDTYRLRDDD